MAAHSSTLAWKAHGRRSLVGCSPWGREESNTTERLHFHFSLSCIGEGNGNPLQCSSLENPRDGGAWWAAVYGVAQSRTRLKRLSSSSSSKYWYTSYIKYKRILCVSTDINKCVNNAEVKSLPYRRLITINSIGEGSGNPLQCSCLENPRDGGAWWASVCRVAQSRMRLKQLSSSSSSCFLT